MIPKQSAPKRTQAQFLEEDFVASASMLEDDELLHLFAFNQLMQAKCPKLADGLKQYEQILANELFRRSVNPYTFTPEEFERVFRFNRQDKTGRDQQIWACRNLLQRRSVATMVN